MFNIRYAIVPARAADDIHALTRIVNRYMPRNYEAIAVTQEDGSHAVLIAGEDVAGWGLDTYVRPRLSSGNYGSREVTSAYAAECRSIPSPE